MHCLLAIVLPPRSLEEPFAKPCVELPLLMLLPLPLPLPLDAGLVLQW